jgi:hypothetical protein
VAPFLAGFQSITLSADLKEEALEAKLVAQGSDANQAKECVASFEAILQKFKAEGEEAATRMPALQPLIDFLGSVKFQVNGAAVTGTATLKSPDKLLMTFPMMMFGVHVQSGDNVSVQRATPVRPAPNVPPGN